MLEGYATIDIFFTVIKSFYFRNFLMQTGITSTFPISFTLIKCDIV